MTPARTSTGAASGVDENISAAVSQRSLTVKLQSCKTKEAAAEERGRGGGRGGEVDTHTIICRARSEVPKRRYRSKDETYHNEKSENLNNPEGLKKQFRIC